MASRCLFDTHASVEGEDGEAFSEGGLMFGFCNH